MRGSSGAGRRRWLAGCAALLAAALLAAGCTGIPTDSQVQDVTKVADQANQAAPLAPDDGQLPEQIVRGFIAASSRTDDSPGSSFSAARQFLTSPARVGWQIDSAATPVVILADGFTTSVDPDQPAQVTVKGTEVGSLDPDHAFHAGTPTPYTVTLHLAKEAGQWRITDPPDSLIIAQSDFGRAFRPRTVYFLDSTGTVVVPDVRYVVDGSSPVNRAGRLIALLLHGPSTLLQGAARTQLGPHASLQKNVSVDAQGVVHVDLTGVDLSGVGARRALAAQIVWTLDPDASQIAITVNGDDLDPAQPVWSLSNVQSFGPDQVPGTGPAVSDGYYIDPSGAILRLSDSSPMYGKVGTGSVRVRSAALSAATGALAAVTDDAADGGEQLLVGRPFDHVPSVQALAADTLTLPSFARSGDEVWTVQNGATKPEIYRVSATGPATRSRVAAPGLADKGEVTALALSPDGVRVAVIAGQKLYIGVITPTDAVGAVSTSQPPPTGQPDAAPGLAVTGLTLLRGDLTGVAAVSFASSTQLLVAADSSRTNWRTAFQVSIDGQSVQPLTISGIFGDVDAIAASSSGEPMLISFGQKIWELDGTIFSGAWRSPVPGGQLWLAGSDPFYPS